MSERVLSVVAAWISAGLLVVVGVVFLFALVIGYGLAGDVPIWTVGFWALLAILSGYGVSCWLLFQLPGQNRTHRLASWGFSAMCHGVTMFLVAGKGG